MESRLSEAKDDNDYLPVLIIGQVGSGKSTLINYLFGKKMGRAKGVGLFKIDVVEGDAKPAICHKTLSSGTKELGEFKDEIKKIFYYDTPPLNDFYDRHPHKAAANISQISQLIDQIKEKKGVIIVVVSVNELDEPYYGLIPLLDTLSEKTQTADCHILFAATKTEQYRDNLTNSDMKNRAQELLKYYENPSTISKKMNDINNWITVNMLTPESCQAILQWIEKVALQKTSTLTKNQPVASKNPQTPKVFKPAPLVIASAEVTQKQTTERSSPTNGC